MLTKDCQSLTDEMAANLSYTRSSLEPYFKKYNACFGQSEIPVAKTRKKISFILKGFLSVNSISSSLKDHYKGGGDKSVSFDRRTTVSFGVEPEFKLPFNKDKWSVFLAPSYLAFESSSGGTTIKCKLIEVPIGLRYYSFLSDKSKLFFNYSYARNIVLGNSEIDYSGFSALEIRSTAGVSSFGAGFCYHDKYSGEIKYAYCASLLNDYIYFSAPVHRVSFVVAFRIL